MIDKNKQIMVVDDDPGLLTLVGIMLKRAGFAVLEAKDAFEALAMLEHTTPDLFILDLMMPRMDGIELCERIRAGVETANTPVLILSARNDRDSVEEGFAVGANDFVSKPIFNHVLVNKVNSLLSIGHEAKT